MLIYRYSPGLDGSSYKYYTLLKAEFGGVSLKSTSAVTNPNNYLADIQRIKPQLVFVHGDWTSYFRIPLKFGIPYIVFEHDIHSLRANLTEKQCQQEVQMLENAAGVIFTSEDHRAYCIKHYPEMTKNIGLVHLRPLKRDIAFYPLPKLKGKHLVYAGGIKNGSEGNYGYRGYKGIFKDFTDAGWTVHIFANYTQQQIAQKNYAPLGIIAHPWVPYWNLTKIMSQFTAGLQAYNKEGVTKRAFDYTQVCRPNKTWDYLAAGIPTIGLNAGNCAKIYEDGGWGVTIPDTKKETIQNIKLPKIDPKNRFEQVMENDIPEFERVINIALTGRTKKTALKIHVNKKGEEDKMNPNDWHVVKTPIFEKGRLLYGTGRRITRSEGVRLGICEPIDTLKAKLQKKAAEREKINQIEKRVSVTPVALPDASKDAVHAPALVDHTVKSDRVKPLIVDHGKKHGKGRKKTGK